MNQFKVLSSVDTGNSLQNVPFSNCPLTLAAPNDFISLYSDYRLSRRLEFRSHYDIACDTLDSEMTKQVAVQAETFYKQLEIVCTDCE